MSLNSEVSADVWGAWPPNHLHLWAVGGTDDAIYAARAHFNSLLASGPLPPSSAGWRRGSSPVGMWITAVGGGSSQGRRCVQPSRARFSKGSS